MRFSICAWILCTVSVILATELCENGIKEKKNVYLLKKQSNETNFTDATESSGRLSKYLSPVNYKIRLQPFINGNLTINGRIEIAFNVVTATNKIVLNMLDILSINETCKVEALGNNTSEANPVVLNQSYHPYYQQYIITLNKNLTMEASYKVSLDFIGFLNDKLVGFYLSTYEDVAGNVRRLAATQFSPTDARRAFPCFDEPLFKATFDIILVRERNMTAWSNMPIKTTKQLSNEWVEDHFNRTLKMSTYLIGFLISDFSSNKSTFLNKTTFSVLTRKEATEQTAYSLFLGPRFLLYFEEYFKIHYPLPKLDMAAIPDFKFNGMENWGLIMYREAAMLVDKDITTVGAKRNMVYVIAHEIAHQWFGNLVTPEWWSELWLKEGFATYMGYSAADTVEPSWKIMEYLVTNNIHSALQLDSLRSSHPINAEVNHPDRITQIFDRISYDKGASIIRMMYHFLSEEVYKRGMTSYLQELKFKNAIQEDLWRFLTLAWTTVPEKAPELSVKTVMDSWTLKQGYPVVHMKMNGSAAILKQKPFLIEGNLLHTAMDFNTSKYGINPNCSGELLKSTWWIPISYTSQISPNFSETKPLLWMKPMDEHSVIKNVSKDSWIVVNVQKTGFYRVNYDVEMWGKLSKQLQTNHSVIHPLNRAQLIDDSFNLARAGTLPYSVVVDIISYLRKEKDLTPWITFFKNFQYVYKQAKFSKEDGLLKKYVRGLLVDIYESLGFDDKPKDSYTTQNLRSEVSKWACKVQHPTCIKDASLYFFQWLNGVEGNFQNIRNNKPVMFCNGMKTINETQWNKAFEIYLKSNLQTEKIDILISLGCVNNSQILERFIQMSLNESSGIRKQDSATVFSVVSNTPMGRNITWNLIKRNWTSIADYFGRGSSSLSKILSSTTRSFATKELLDEFLKFTLDYEKDLEFVKQGVDQYFEGGILNSLWKRELFPEFLMAIKNKLGINT